MRALLKAVVLAGVPGHLERVVQEGGVHPRVVARVLKDFQNAQRLLFGRDDRREECEVVSEVRGRYWPGFAAGGSATGRWVSAGSAAGASTGKLAAALRCGTGRPPRRSSSPTLSKFFLTGELEEALRSPQPDRSGRRVDGGQCAVKELLVELGRRKCGAGQLSAGFECVFYLAGDTWLCSGTATTGSARTFSDRGRTHGNLGAAST